MNISRHVTLLVVLITTENTYSLCSCDYAHVLISVSGHISSMTQKVSQIGPTCVFDKTGKLEVGIEAMLQKDASKMPLENLDKD